MQCIFPVKGAVCNFKSNLIPMKIIALGKDKECDLLPLSLFFFFFCNRFGVYQVLKKFSSDTEELFGLYLSLSHTHRLPLEKPH